MHAYIVYIELRYAPTYFFTLDNTMDLSAERAFIEADDKYQELATKCAVAYAQASTLSKDLSKLQRKLIIEYRLQKIPMSANLRAQLNTEGMLNAMMAKPDIIGKLFHCKTEQELKAHLGDRFLPSSWQ